MQRMTLQVSKEGWKLFSPDTRFQNKKLTQWQHHPQPYLPKIYEIKWHNSLLLLYIYEYIWLFLSLRDTPFAFDPSASRRLFSVTDLLLLYFNVKKMRSTFPLLHPVCVCLFQSTLPFPSSALTPLIIVCVRISCPFLHLNNYRKSID